MEWAAIAAGVVAGIGSGFLSAVATPFAQRRAEVARERSAQRRALIDQGRALVAEARREAWSASYVSEDARFLELRPHLSEDLRLHYYVQGSIEERTLHIGEPMHHRLLDAIDELEKKWKLI